jgi:hypothetical protein
MIPQSCAEGRCNDVARCEMHVARERLESVIVLVAGGCYPVRLLPVVLAHKISDEYLPYDTSQGQLRNGLYLVQRTQVPLYGTCTHTRILCELSSVIFRLQSYQWYR